MITGARVGVRKISDCPAVEMGTGVPKLSTTGVPSTGSAPPVVDEDDPAEDARLELLLTAPEDAVLEEVLTTPEDVVTEVALAAPEDALFDAPLDAALEEGPAPELLLPAPEAPLLLTSTEDPLLLTSTEDPLEREVPLEVLAAELLPALAELPARLVEPATLDAPADEPAPDEDEDEDASSPVAVVHAEPRATAANSKTRFIGTPLFSGSLTRIGSCKMVVFGGCSPPR